MNEHYVTVFDRGFLPQGLALHRSLQTHGGAHTLWIVCMDEETHDVLTRLALPHTRPIEFSAIETEALMQVRPRRTTVEFCWTVTPFAPRAVFDADPSVTRVTYLDADVSFLRTPASILDEFSRSGKHVLITDHAYAPECDSSSATGQYCVQFMTFTRDGERVRQWWAERCLEWCFARIEDGKYGDQKYLDDWPVRFADAVHVLQHPEWTLAPWNVTRFPYGSAVLYHFHGLGLLQGDRVALGPYAIPPVVIRHVYEPYLAALREALKTLRRIGFTPSVQQRTPPRTARLKQRLSSFYAQRWRLKTRHIRPL